MIDEETKKIEVDPAKVVEENVYDLDLHEEPIRFRLKGKLFEYTMRELSGKERDAYLTGLFGRMKPGPDGKNTLKDADKLQASMVCKALFKADGSAVDADEINGWPSRVVKALFEKVKAMSALDDKAEADAKND